MNGNDRGFTLIEVLVSILILAAISVAILNTLLFVRTMSRDEIVSKTALFQLEGFLNQWQHDLLVRTDFTDNELRGNQFTKEIILDRKSQTIGILTYGPIIFEEFFTIPAQIEWIDSQNRKMTHKLVAYQRRNE